MRSVRNESRICHVVGFRFPEFGRGCRDVCDDCSAQARRRKVPDDGDNSYDEFVFRMAFGRTLGTHSPSDGDNASSSRLA